MQTVTVAEAAEKLTDLIDAALRGEEIVITKGDRIIQLTPKQPVKRYPAKAGTAKGQVWMSEDFEKDFDDKPISTKPRPKFGSAKGLIEMSDDFDEPLEDFQDYM